MADLFPSFGYLLAVDPSQADRLKRRGDDPDRSAAGSDGSPRSLSVQLERAGESECFWQDPLA